jgi:transcriptional regulator with GAF, ATPase, and Fis domain
MEGGDLQPVSADWVGLNAELAERLEFETLLADLSARFVNVPVDQVDREIDECQRRLCHHLRIDRSSVWQMDADGSGAIRLSHLFQPPDFPVAEGNPDARDYFPWVIEQLGSGRPVVIRSLDDVPAEAVRDREMFGRYRTKSTMVFPLTVSGGSMIGILALAALREERRWPAAVVTRCQVVAQIFAGALERKRHDEEMRRTLNELHRLQEQLQHENVHLRRVVQTVHGQMPIVGNSEALRKVLAQAQQVAATGSTVLILGETGTGKELLASYLHRIGRRCSKPFVTTSVAAIPGTLLESEMFGREKGAFTGALSKQLGRFELADGGTLFLDEIGEMPMETQAKLLRVLQSGEFERLGSSRTLRVDVQLIAATNRRLPDLIQTGAFRQDLFYRLNIFPITLPPLRERLEDIPMLVWAFVKELSAKMGKPIDRIPQRELDGLREHSWPGNVRELRNVIERSMIMTVGSELSIVMPESPQAEKPDQNTLRDVERAHVLRVLRSTGGRIRGSAGAAEILGMKPTTLYSLMERMGIDRHDVR